MNESRQFLPPIDPELKRKALAGELGQGARTINELRQEIARLRALAMGPVFAETWRRNPERTSFASTRYKWVMRMLTDCDLVAEIGAADGFLSEIVRSKVKRLCLYDIEPATPHIARHDIVQKPLWPLLGFDAIYMIDVLEHIAEADEAAALKNICSSLAPNGIFIAGVPSLESQQYANEWSKIGHVNCKSGDDLRAAMQRYFANVFLFTMNDEMVGTGFPQMAHYLFVLCCGPKV